MPFVTIGRVCQRRAKLRGNADCAELTLRPRCVVDDAGVGGGVTDIARRRGWHIFAHNGGNRAVDPRRFANLRSDVAWHFRKLLEEDKVALPRIPRLADEAMALTCQLTSKGLIQLTSKKDLEGIAGSTDLTDACMQALSQSVPMAGNRARVYNIWAA